MPTEDEIEITKLHLRLASRRSQAKSWLSAYEETDANESNSQKEDSRVDFAKGSDELAGIGAASDEADDVLTDDRRMLQVNADLRRRLLTREGRERFAGWEKANGGNVQREARKQKRDESSDEDEGRSGVGGRKRALKKDQDAQGNVGAQAEGQSQGKRKRAGTNYLDQILAQRQQKRNKKSVKGG